MNKKGSLTAKQVFELLESYYKLKGVQMSDKQLIQEVGNETPVENVIRGKRFFTRYLNNLLGQSYGPIEPLYGYEKLTEAERKVFIQGHAKHLKQVPDENKICYALNEIVEVRGCKEGGAVEARFSSGQWIQYKKEGDSK